MKVEIIAEHKADLLREGFVSAGYAFTDKNNSPAPDDVLVAWNRKPQNKERIKFYEKAGAKVVIAENGYIGKDDHGNKLLALAQNKHLGLGKWFVGEEPRYLQQNFMILPWKEPGKNIVLLAQRGIGNAKKLHWYNQLAHEIRQQTKRKVIVRPHPGKNPTPLAPVLDNAHCVVTWSSAAALHALAYGVPSFHLLEGWIGELASRFGLDELENPLRGDRIPMFHRIGWAQWSADEIRSGEAIKKVMSA